MEDQKWKLGQYVWVEIWLLVVLVASQSAAHKNKLQNIFFKNCKREISDFKVQKKCKSKPSNTVQNKKAPSQCALKVWLNVGGESFFGTYLEKLLPVKWLIGVDVLKVVENVHLAKWMFSLLDNMKLCSCARPNDGMKKISFSWSVI